MRGLVIWICCALAGLGCGDTLGSGGPFEPPSTGTLHEGMTLEHGGKTRTFHFYQAEGDDPRPLVFVLHGGGADIDAFIGKTGGAAPLAGVWLGLAARERLHLVIPQGLASAHGAHWNDCRADCTACGEEDDVGFLLALLDHLSARYPVDAARVYASGESNGGFMALRLGQEHPDRFAAVGTVIAQMPGANDCQASTRPLPVVMVLGTADQAVPYAGGSGQSAASGTFASAADSVAHWVAHNRCEAAPSESAAIEDGPEADGSTVTRTSYACPATGAAVRHFRIEGGGHAVPSIEQQVSAAWELIVGKQNHDIETAAEHWSFFSAHTSR